LQLLGHLVRSVVWVSLVEVLPVVLNRTSILVLAWSGLLRTTLVKLALRSLALSWEVSSSLELLTSSTLSLLHQVK